MRDWACICILEEMRLCRIKETEWWVWWKPWRVEELKIDKAFSGGLFTIFWIRTRASLVRDIFSALALNPRNVTMLYSISCLPNGPGQI